MNKTLFITLYEKTNKDFSYLLVITNHVIEYARGLISNSKFDEYKLVFYFKNRASYKSDISTGVFHFSLLKFITLLKGMNKSTKIKKKKPK